MESISSLIDSDQNKDFVLKKIRDVSYLNQATATGDAINMANAIFSRFRRSLTPRVLLLFTDGFTNVGKSAILSADNLRKTNVSIFSIGIGNGISLTELQQIADKPSSEFVKLVSDYSELVNSINSITVKTCSIPAFVVKNEKFILTTESNEIRNLQLNLNEENGYVEIESKNLKGSTELSISWLISDQIFNESIQEIQSEHILLEIPENAERIYLKLKGIQNENIIELIVLTK